MIFGILVLAIVGTSSLPLDGDGNFLANMKEKAYENKVMEIRNKSIGLPDLRVGEKLSKWKKGQGNPEELGSYFEGDILHPPSLTRNGIIDRRFRWPQGIVPYRIAGQFTTRERQLLDRAFYIYQMYTCIRFRPIQTGDRDYVSIEKSTAGCYSSVGRIGGKQVVNLSTGCLYDVATPIHELMHAIGFFHEQSRMDRDRYVDIIFANIRPGMEYNFRIEYSSPFGQGYDFNSVMHYSETAFSRNGQPTIRTKPANIRIGQRDGISATDVAKINLMYGCRR